MGVTGTPLTVAGEGREAERRFDSGHVHWRASTARTGSALRADISRWLQSTFRPLPEGRLCLETGNPRRTGGLRVQPAHAGSLTTPEP